MPPITHKIIQDCIKNYFKHTPVRISQSAGMLLAITLWFDFMFDKMNTYKFTFFINCRRRSCHLQTEVTESRGFGEWWNQWCLYFCFCSRIECCLYFLQKSFMWLKQVFIFILKYFEFIKYITYVCEKRKRVPLFCILK